MKINSDESKDQANDLRSLIQEVENEHEKKPDESLVSNKHTVEKREVDILNLPPRKEIHSVNQRTRFKISKPLFRLLLVILLLIIIFIVASYFFGDELMTLIEI
ncbi:hypothetical protein ACFOUV_03685 [Oceanobacillus longus]|uniref:Uncharacterized protein n=1 Tax=Oceanobacillus longus TaxID=930120 RepID=A0ABV8GWH1_9BACI